MKRFLEKCLICIVIMMLISNFIMSTPVSFAYIGETKTETSEETIEIRMIQGEKKLYKATAGDWISGLFSGLIGIITWVPRALMLAVAVGLNGILSAFAAIGMDVSGDGLFVTVFDVFFNKIEILDVNFLNLSTENDIVKTFRSAVAGWYYTMRLIASMVLVVILVYIGIRMALSTIASEKAMYKKMLVDWVCSLALLFLLHYIMIFIFACNTALVNAMAEIAEGTDMTTFMNNLVLNALGVDVVQSFASLAIYAMIIFQTLTFILTYVKRMLTIGFLIIIAPLITVTYSIDKMGDQKAQALNTWLKEFSYNILIQPFHCILFLSFAKVAMDLLSSNPGIEPTSLATAVLALLCIQYIKTGEELVKKIFGFDKADSLASMAAGAVMAGAFISKGSQIGKAAGGLARKAGKGAIKGLKNGKSIPGKIANSKAGKLVGNAATKLGNTKAGKAVSGAISGAKNKTASRAAAKDDAAAIALAQKRKREKGDFSEVSEDEKKSAMKQIKADRAAKAQKRKDNKAKISGAAGKVANSAVGKYVAANKSKIAGVMVGSVLGAAGLANGAAGMVAGYKMGSGFVEGLVPNASATINQDVSGAAQGLANITGETNVANLVYNALMVGDNDGFKDLAKTMQQLIDKLNSLGAKNGAEIVGSLSSQISTNPASVTQDTIRMKLKDSGISEDKQEEAFKLLNNGAGMMMQKSLYSAVSASKGLGNSTEDVISKIGTVNSTATNTESITTEESTTETTTTVEVSTSDIDVSELADNISKQFGTQAQQVVSDIEARRNEINKLIQDFNSAGESQKQGLVDAIRTKTGDATLDASAIEAHLKSELSKLNS